MNATRIIKVFLASSITELKKERFELAGLEYDIANLFSQDNIAVQFVKCENIHFGNIGEDDQKDIDEILCDCEMSLFLFKTKVEPRTVHEFEVARTLQKEGLHKVFVYFINTPGEEKDESFEAFQERLNNENVFWQEYDDLREVKFSFAMEVLNHIGITANEGTKESKKIAKDGDSRFEQYKNDKQRKGHLRKDIHLDIEDLLAQINTILSDDNQLISSRIIQVNELYQKADRWAAATAYNKEKYSDLLFDYARFLYKYGLYKDSEAIYLRQIPLVEKLHGTESVDAATSYNSIGTVYNAQGDYGKALEYYFKALEIDEKVLGIEHPSTATSYNNIGEVYDKQGDYDKALEYYVKALSIREKVLGTEHPETATSYNNIGRVYASQGDYGKALEYYSKALAIREKKLGKEHPDTATSYNNIGRVSASQGDYGMALEYYFKAMKIYEKNLGVKHPSTAITYNNIGRAYASQGDYGKALEYYFKALAITERVLGKEHPSTAISYNNIGSVYASQGEYDMALVFFSKALSIREKVLGENHPDTVQTYNDIGLVYKEQGNYDLSEDYYNKVLAIRKEQPYEFVFDIGGGTTDLSLMYDIIRKNYSSKLVIVDTKGIETTTSFNFETAISYNNLGEVLKKKGDYKNALTNFLNALTILEKLRGEKDANATIATSYNGMGHIHYYQGDYTKAREFLDKAYRIREKLFGINSVETEETSLLLEIVNVLIANDNKSNH